MKRVVAIALSLSSLFLASAAQAESVDGARAYAHYVEGEYLQAIALWRQSLQGLSDPTEIAQTKLQIGHSQRALGYPIRACQSYSEVLELSRAICDVESVNANAPVKAEISPNEMSISASIALANVLRDMGKFSQAREFAKHADLQANQMDIELLSAGAKLSQVRLLTDQLKLRRDRLIFQGREKLSPDESRSVLTSLSEAYELSEAAIDSPLSRDALSHWLKVYQEHQEWLSLMVTDSLLSQKQPKVVDYLNSLRQSTPSEELKYRKVQHHLNLAKILFGFSERSPKGEFVRQAFDEAATALRLAQSIGNAPLIASAYHQLADLYSINGQSSEAIRTLSMATRFAQSIDHASLLYQSHRKLARLYRSEDEITDARQNYEAAIDSLRRLETETSWLPSEIRIEFQSEVQTFFDDYLSFLLAQERPDFRKVLQVQDQFNRSLLQNYLGCSTLNTLALSELSNESNSAIVTILKAGQAYHTVIFVGDRVSYGQVEATEIDAIIQQLNLIFSDNTSTSEVVVRRRFQRLYEKLLAAPISNIPEGTTLLFRNLEPNLQQLPMALMHDRETYLIERYPIALIGNTLYEPRMLDLNQTDILFAGISEQSQTFRSFSPLPHVVQEKSSIGPETTLFNHQFTKGRFLERLQGDTPIIHVASHGQFSSNPDETFLLAWDQKITLDSISGVIADRAERTPNPIELLVLSACQTAKGDRLAALGMAGLAIQSGARSTVASLWNANDPATAFLMDQFYTNLETGMTKAEALQQAQLVTMKQPEFNNPYFWANFILLGSWL